MSSFHNEEDPILNDRLEFSTHDVKTNNYIVSVIRLADGLVWIEYPTREPRSAQQNDALVVCVQCAVWHADDGLSVQYDPSESGRSHIGRR